MATGNQPMTSLSQGKHADRNAAISPVQERVESGERFDHLPANQDLDLIVKSAEILTDILFLLTPLKNWT